MKEKIFRDIKIVVVTLIFMSAIVLTFIISRNIALNGESKITGETIKKSLVDISELNTAEYCYTHVVSYNSGDQKIFWGAVTVPYTSSEGVYSYQGTVTAGIDFSKIEVTVDETEKEIKFVLPDAVITDSHVDNDSLETYYEHNNVFNPMTVITYNELVRQVDEAERESAVQNGLLERANSNAKIQIESFVRAMYDMDNYKIIFETASQNQPAPTENPLEAQEGADIPETAK